MTASSTIIAALIAIANAVIAVFTYLTSVHNNKNDKTKITEQKIDDAKDKIEEACNNGSLSDLLDATTDLGDAKK